MFNPGGDMFSNTLAKNVATKYTDIVFICGRYEGIDARVKKNFEAKEWSIGNYVLTGENFLQWSVLMQYTSNKRNTQ